MEVRMNLPNDYSITNHLMLLLYPKSDGMPTHWPRQVSCPTLHMSAHSCKLRMEEQTSTIEEVSLKELTPNEQGSCFPSADRGCTPSASNPPQGLASKGCSPSTSALPTIGEQGCSPWVSNRLGAARPWGAPRPRAACLQRAESPGGDSPSTCRSSP